MSAWQSPQREEPTYEARPGLGPRGWGLGAGAATCVSTRAASTAPKRTPARTTLITKRMSPLRERLVLRGVAVPEFVRKVVVAGGLEPDGHVVIRGVFPIPAVNAGKRRGQRTGWAAAGVLL